MKCRTALRRLVPSLLFTLLPWLVVAPAFAFEPWTVEDLLKGETVRQMELSPDASLAVWNVQSLQKVGKDDKRISHLWARSLKDRNAKSVQLTRGEHDTLAFHISPDGQNLAFLTPRPVPGSEDASGPQIWLLPLTSGGEARPLTSFDRGVEAFEFLDADTLLLRRAEGKSAREREREKLGDAAEVVADPTEVPPVRLFTLKIASGEVKRLAENAGWVHQQVVSPDGKKAVLLLAVDLDYEFNSKVPPKTFLLDVASGKWQEILAGARLIPQSVRWAADSQSFYFSDARSSHPFYETASVLDLHRFDLRKGESTRIDLQWERGLAESPSPFWPLPPAKGAAASDLLVLLADGVRFRGVRFTAGPQGSARRELEGKHVGKIERFVVADDGKTVLYQASAINEPPQLYAARLDGHRLVDEWQVSDLHGQFANKDMGRYEIVRWKGALDEEVEGILLYPFTWEKGRKFPLVLDIHGGPTAADFDSWDLSLNRIWQERGAFVLQVNYHGSSSYGLAWVESIRERYYELEIPDIEAGVDELIRRGLVDPDRLASTGWSNGGILTAELITRTERYQAAVVGAADVEWISDWANVDFGASFDNYYFGGPPWERVQHYLDKSPFFRLDRVKTPTIIHTGTADRSVPPHQSWSLFRALQEHGQTPVRFLTYPGEPHGLQKIGHRRRRLSEDVAWLDKYLFEKPEPRDPAIPRTSSLAALLELQGASRDAAGRYGVVEGGVLLPEIVAYGDLDVGRFEVTRAQMAAFDPTYEVVAGEENLPATGISFEQAKAYAAWVAQKIAGARLPTAAEMAKLAGKGGRGGNTLDRWLGYPANPEDAARARMAAAAIGPSALLQPVGSGNAAYGREDGPAVYDLDGNAAEWVSTENGGKAAGPSADRSSDATSTQEAGAFYTGLRLVVGDEKPKT